MAFMPFPIHPRGPRQQAPNYTPQLVQQTGSDILGAILAMIQLKATQGDNAADRALRREELGATRKLAEDSAALARRQFEEVAKPGFDLQRLAAERGMKSEDVAQALNWAQQFGGGIDLASAETIKNLERPIAAQIAAGQSRVSPILERLRGSTNRFNVGDLTGTDFAKIIAGLGADVDSLTKEGDPFSRASGARSLNEALAVLEGLGDKDIQAASGDLRRMYQNYFSLDPATLRSTLEGKITSDFSLNKNKAMTSSLEDVARVREGTTTVGDILPGIKQKFMASPMNYQQALGLLSQPDLSARSIIPTQSPGAMVPVGNAIWNFIPGLGRGLTTESFPVSSTPDLSTVTPGSIHNTPEYQALEAAMLMQAQQFIGPPAPMMPAGNTNTALEELLRGQP